MATFSVIVLVLILIALSIYCAYLTAKIFKENDEGNLMAFLALAFVYGLIVCFLLRYIIIWGYPLVTH
jgi:hypothetical protein